MREPRDLDSELLAARERRASKSEPAPGGTEGDWNWGQPWAPAATIKSLGMDEHHAMIAAQAAGKPKRKRQRQGGALTSDSAERKTAPMFSGLLAYFPAALMEVSKMSKVGSDKHNPGLPMYHDRGKSMDHADCLVRHLLEHGHVDPDDGVSHTVKVAWRALALLQEELENAGAPLARGAKAASGG